ncbi:MAG TPA: hypothetical protein VF669_04460 [Tepidisphaeraceae bacterium]|jgi:hypothetical protein
MKAFLNCLAAAAVTVVAFSPITRAAAILSPGSTVNLSSSLGSTAFNFNPVGLGYDSTANELLFAQQQNNTLYRTNLTGAILGSRTIGSVPTASFGPTAAQYTVSVAADATNYYFSDYNSNHLGYDLYAIGKTSGAATNISSELAAYGGYPIDVRDGRIYRTNPSTTYDYYMLDQIRVSTVAAPDVIQQTINLPVPGGIADFTIDTANNCIWASGYTASTSIYRYDLTTGALLDTFPLALDGLTSGLTVANNKLYFYDWADNASTLTTYTIVVPEPTSLVICTIAATSLLRRR